MPIIQSTKIQLLNNSRGLGILRPDEYDSRDLLVGIFGWGKYEPKHTDILLETVSIKNQFQRNTCTFESVVAQKEPDEGVELSVMSVVRYAYSQGYIQGNGFSSLKLSQQCILDFGAQEALQMPDVNLPWSEYCKGYGMLTKEEASKHRSKSYWKITNMNEVYKALDDGRIVQFALDWYTKYNMERGFRAPWILPYKQGLYVGGHGLIVKGYNQKYYDENVVILQQSFGPAWGENGTFYMRVEDFQRELSKYGGYLNLDIEEDTGKFLRDYTGEAVKVDGEAPVYLIENGTKRGYVNMQAYINHEGYGKPRAVPKSILEKIPDGELIYS